MASNRAVTAVVTAIFAAARAPVGDQEPLFAKALSGMTDTEVADAALYVVRTQSWDFGLKPSPALIVDRVKAVRARSARPSSPQEPVTPADQLPARVADVRALIYPRRQA